AIVLLLMHGLRAGFLVDPWNPRVIVLGMLAFILLCWDAIDAQTRWSLPLAVAVGSLLIQSHVGAALAVGTVLAIACTSLVLDARKAREWNRLRPTALLALGVGVLCWLPPAIEGLAHSGGNIRALWKYWSAHHAVITGPAAGARIVGAQLALPAPWFT